MRHACVGLLFLAACSSGSRAGDSSSYSDSGAAMCCVWEADANVVYTCGDGGCGSPAICEAPGVGNECTFSLEACADGSTLINTGIVLACDKLPHR